MTTREMKTAIVQAYREGSLKVEAVSPDSGEVDVYVVADVMRHEIPHKRVFRITTEIGAEVVATEDHSLFLRTDKGIQEVETGALQPGDEIAVCLEGDVIGARVLSVREEPAHRYMYDLSVPGPENFVLANGVVAHNSYSIGGISLDIDKSSKYESLKQNAEGQQDKAAEAKARTVKFIRGLQQPKFGFGVRSVSGCTLVRVLHAAHEEDVEIATLYERCHGEDAVWSSALSDMSLRVRAVDPDTGDVSVRLFDAVLRHDTTGRPLVRVCLNDGRSTVFTRDHSLFYRRGAGLQVVEAGRLKEGDQIITWTEGAGVTTSTVATLQDEPSERYTYDLSVPGPQNFVLSNGILAHNSSFGPNVGRGVLSPRSFV